MSSDFSDEIRRIKQENEAKRLADQKQQQSEAELTKKHQADGSATAVRLRTDVIEPLAKQAAAALSWKVDFDVEPDGQKGTAIECAFTAPDGPRRVLTVKFDWAIRPQFKAYIDSPTTSQPRAMHLSLDEFDNEQFKAWWKEALLDLAKRFA
jgi:hypothetical protein